MNDHLAPAIGWASTLVLLATLIRQVYSQWKSGSIGGVSKWLFVGQMAASAGFIAYSWLLKNWIFTLSNLAILMVAIVGESLFAYRRRNSMSAKSKGCDL